MHFISVLIISLLIKSSICYTLHTAAACFAKKSRATKFNISNFIDEPLRDDGSECGEDDFSLNRKRSIFLFNLADGVGAWSDEGIDPKIFAHELLKSIDEEFMAANINKLMMHERKNSIFLKRIIVDAFSKVQQTKAFIEYGSCTLVTLSLNIRTLILNSFVLGDSSFMIIRNRKILYRSVDLSHGFNWPYQLAFQSEFSDDPLVGKILQFQLKPLDIIIIGSDGLFDNLFDEAILHYVNEKSLYLSTKTKDELTEMVKRVAKGLTYEAKIVGESKYGTVASPFSEEVNYLGILDEDVFAGKNDDTTVVVAIIS